MSITAVAESDPILGQDHICWDVSINLGGSGSSSSFEHMIDVHKNAKFSLFPIHVRI